MDRRIKLGRGAAGEAGGARRAIAAEDVAGRQAGQRGRPEEAGPMTGSATPSFGRLCACTDQVGFASASGHQALVIRRQ
jgi:hypothetical protein